MLLSRALRNVVVPGTVLAVSVFGLGCGRDKEGIYAGECRNGIDEDRDGRMDCADSDCAGSPDCAERSAPVAEELDDSSPVSDWDLPEVGDDTGMDADVRYSKEAIWRGVAAGIEHTCALRTDHTMACFGRPPTSMPEEDVTAGLDGTYGTVGSGQGFSCAIDALESDRDGIVACWGAPTYEATQPPAGGFASLALGYSHGCAQATDGSMACWGWAGHNATTPPTGVVVDYDLGYHFGCAVLEGGTLTCWGKDLFNGNVEPPSGTYASVDVGAMFGCALATVPGPVVCWGDNGLGQASPPADDFASISLGAGHGCGIRVDGTLACWGDNVRGQASPPESGGWIEVSAGAHHTCAVDEAGWMACWGWNESERSQPPE